MAAESIKTKYNEILDFLEDKLKTDSRMNTTSQQWTTRRGTAVDEPKEYPIIFISEGKIDNIGFTSQSRAFKIELVLEYYIKRTTPEEGAREITQRTLDILDTLVQKVADRQLEKDGIALANGPTGLDVASAEFGWFTLSETSYIFKGQMTVTIDFEADYI